MNTNDQPGLPLNDITEYISACIQKMCVEENMKFAAYPESYILGRHRLKVPQTLLVHVHEDGSGKFPPEPFERLVGRFRSICRQHKEQGHAALLSGYEVEGPFQVGIEQCTHEKKNTHAAWKLCFRLVYEKR